jgi:chemotaxis protein MotB
MLRFIMAAAVFIVVFMTIHGKNKEIDSLKKQVVTLTEEKDETIEEKERSIKEVKKTYDNLMAEMSQEIKTGEITITQLKDKLSVNLVDQILFDSGSAEIKKGGKKVLDRVTEILKKVTDKHIRIEGHTDDVQLSRRIRAKFASNWELSTARATTVARYLQMQGIEPRLLAASGYSSYRPIAKNNTDAGRAKNRRIEIVLTPIEETPQK